MPNRVLSARALERLKVFLAEPAVKYDVNNPDGYALYSKILGWAEDPEYGGLPSYSAVAFAHWLDDAWSDFYDGDESVTVEQALKGAVEQWCGGRTL
jgi:hypothetical protein